MKLFSYKKRPVHLGPFLYERLKQAPSHQQAISLEKLPYNARNGLSSPHTMDGTPISDDVSNSDGASISNFALEEAIEQHFETYLTKSANPIASHKHPEGLSKTDIAHTLKSAAYFMDAQGVGIAALNESAWLKKSDQSVIHDTAIVIVCDLGRDPSNNKLAKQWTKGLIHQMAELRATEIATVIANQIRILGFDAAIHRQDSETLDQQFCATQSGMFYCDEDGLSHPFLGKNHAFVTITTNANLPADKAIERRKGLAKLWQEQLPFSLGLKGTHPRRHVSRKQIRAAHLSLYPEETIKRVDSTTTKIMEDDIPRIPKRASFFERARRGDLGGKTQGERERFAAKETLSHSILSTLGHLVPLQKGNVNKSVNHEGDVEQNTQALKSLAHWMGADLTGVCRIPEYAWYSHQFDGSDIAPEHENAIVIVIDQGHETMEGASGDDWVSGSQSMRAYLRAAEITNLMAAHIRGLGYEASSHTSADGDLLHIPLIMKAGLGELSRIGEVVLNPFLGPRFKTGIISTNMPLKADKPIDFNLQRFCDSCFKCARECPCDAISFGSKVMFNGYEMWKPDVERCARWRITNVRGSSCGRCMKMCPFNQEDTIWSRLMMWAMRTFPFGHKALANLDDHLGHGKRNPIKKWWFDLEVINNRAHPARGVNERDLNLERNIDKLKEKHQVAVYPAHRNPDPTDPGPTPPNRKQALEDAKSLPKA